MCTGEEAVVPAALRGYRTWDITGGGELASLRLPYRWQFGAQRARCLAQDCNCWVCRLRPGFGEHHDAPNAGCECGIYGWYAPNDTRLMGGSVFGAIEVTGRVLMGTHGFRAERARVLGLVIEGPALLSILYDRCRDNLVQIYHSRSELIAALPPDDVSHLVDHRCGEECRQPSQFGPVVFHAAGVVQAAGRLREAAAAAAALNAAYTKVAAVAATGSATTLTPAEAALEARRNRNTGPRRRLRAPRFLSPRRPR